MASFMTVSEAARRLAVSAETVRRWSTVGLLRCERTDGHVKVRLYLADEVERFRLTRELTESAQAGAKEEERC
jgi:excisionase family DNA binding protein